MEKYDIQHQLNLRAGARKRKDFEESDRIRDFLVENGIVLQDTPGGVVWKEKAFKSMEEISSYICSRLPLKEDFMFNASVSIRYDATKKEYELFFNGIKCKLIEL